MAQGRSTKIISMIEWIRTSRLSIKNSLSLSAAGPPSPADVGIGALEKDRQDPERDRSVSFRCEAGVGCRV